MRVPKEHGAWAMLYVPFAAGVLAGGRAALGNALPLVLLLGAVTGLFLGRDSLLAWLRARDRALPTSADRWATVWQLGGALLCGIGLVAIRPPLGERVPLQILPLGVFGAIVLIVHLLQMRRREARTVVGEVLAILGLTCTAPAALLVARAAWSPYTMWLWFLCVLFFASSVFHVKARVLAQQARRAAARDAMRRASATYHIALFVALVAGAVAGRLHPLLLAAYLPVIVRALVALVTPPGKLNLTRAGVLEIFYSLVFLVGVTLAGLRS
jgi:hypothetical protein